MSLPTLPSKRYTIHHRPRIELSDITFSQLLHTLQCHWEISPLGASSHPLHYFHLTSLDGEVSLDDTYMILYRASVGYMMEIKTWNFLERSTC